MAASDKSAERAIKAIREQRTNLESIGANELKDQLPRWFDRTKRMLNDLLLRDEVHLFESIDTKSYAQDRKAFIKCLDDFEKGILELPEHFLRTDAPSAEIDKDSRSSNRVFIVHGHDHGAKVDVARTIEQLKLCAIVLHEQASEGKTIIEKFERDASQVSFAIALLTGDDEGYCRGKPEEKTLRARQNVILELGYFSGALGRSKVCVVSKDEVEIPSDYLGVAHISMDEGGAWKYALAMELKTAGLPIDLNDLDPNQ
jgi:predicted nucleotide-binding protein